MFKVLIIDNFDSFTYNLVHLLEGVDAEVKVVRNDALNNIDISNFHNIVISPGPGTPSDIPQVKQFFLKHYKTKNILGVCLGHQLIAECFENKVELSKTVFHGISTPISRVGDSKLFKNLPEKFNVGRYHSWLVSSIDNAELTTTAISEERNVMAFQHVKYDVYGIQFHPESILSEYGKEVILNWLK